MDGIVMKIVYYANGKTMVGSKNARDISEKNLRKVIEQIVSVVKYPDIEVDMDKVGRTNITENTTKIPKMVDTI